MKNSTRTLSILLLCIGVLHTKAAVQNEIALVIKSRGLVSISHRDASGYAMVSKGYLIMPGAVLQTGSSGFAIVKYISSGSIVVVRPRSEVIFNAFHDGNVLNESLEMMAGEALFEIQQPRKHSFDLHTSAALVSFKEAKSLVILSKNNDGTALYNLEGTAQIADNNFTTWKDLNPESAAFAAQNGFVQISTLPKTTVPRLRDIFESTRRLKSGPLLVHDVTVRASPHGTVEPTGKLVVLSGVDVDIKAVPEEEYTFTGWKVLDGNARVKDISSVETQVSVLSNTLIEAQFGETPSILRIVKSESGLTEPVGDMFIQRGVPVTIRVAPNEGFEFSGWKTTSNIKIKEIDPFETQVSLLANRGKIYPRFIKKSYQLTVLKSENGSVTPNKTVAAGHGDSVTLSAVPHEGYQFIRWEIVEGYADIANPYNANTSIICDSIDAAIQAHFSNNAVEVSILGHELADISPTGNFFVIRNSVLTVNVKPKTGSMVSRWIIERGKARIRGLENAVVKCRTPFEIRPVISAREYSLTLLGNKYGMILPAGTKKVTHKRPFTIIAKPNEGMHFIRWRLSGGWAEFADVQKDSTQVSLSQGDAVIQAEFAETICTLTVASTHGGYTEPSGAVNNYEGGDIIVQAVPNPKAAFIGWEIAEGEENVLFSDTLTIAEQTVTSTKGNASIKAVFSTETVEMNVLTNGFGTTVPEGKFYAVKNKWIRIEATPNEDQRFVQWTVISGNEVKFKDPLSAETEVYAGSEDAVVKALFQSSGALEDSIGDISQQGEYLLTVEYDEEKGSIDTEKEMTVRAGVPVVITATPKKEYILDQWRVTKGSALFSDRYSQKTTVILNKEDAVITPVFRLKSLHTLEVIFKDYEGISKTIRSTYR